MLMYNLIEYSGNYSNTSRIISEYYRDEPSLNDDGVSVINKFFGICASFIFKQKITDETGHDGTKDKKYKKLK